MLLPPLLLDGGITICSSACNVDTDPDDALDAC